MSSESRYQQAKAAIAKYEVPALPWPLPEGPAPKDMAY
ncbi:hypothetical protein QFZ36_001509 [Pseudarthrobacter siccitolerans]|uniref:Uncharacterized protein n=1 Tax=Pseudarthrobacter siccitolerans TaxID=861266 RepID=A0ABU0PJ12_9MICC|nr:hypothetical protein [Pseudarthrobacter siccitolerans]